MFKRLVCSMLCLLTVASGALSMAVSDKDKVADNRNLNIVKSMDKYEKLRSYVFVVSKTLLNEFDKSNSKELTYKDLSGLALKSSKSEVYFNIWLDTVSLVGDKFDKNLREKILKNLTFEELLSVAESFAGEADKAKTPLRDSFDFLNSIFLNNFKEELGEEINKKLGDDNKKLDSFELAVKSVGKEKLESIFKIIRREIKHEKELKIKSYRDVKLTKVMKEIEEALKEAILLTPKGESERNYYSKILAEIVDKYSAVYTQVIMSLKDIDNMNNKV